MSVLDVVSYAWGGIRLRKLRAALTTLGVIIGIAAVVALLSLGEGFRVSMASQLERGFPSDVLLVRPAQAFFTTDATRIINTMYGVRLSTAAISVAVTVSSRNITQTVRAVGVNFGDYSEIYNKAFAARSGSIPLVPTSNSIVLGAAIADPWRNGTIFADVGDYVILYNLYGDITHPITETYLFHVVAVLQEVGGFGTGGVLDNQIYIPLSAAQTIFQTSTSDLITVRLVDGNQTTIDSVTKEVSGYFNNRVIVTSAEDTMRSVANIFSTLQLFLAGIAGISLVVAGIGIMNIMFVAALERTREIGILKTLGMKSRTVMVIFLCEAVIIGFLGAAMGIALGWGLSNFFARFDLGAWLGNVGQIGGSSNAGFGVGITPILTPMILVGASVVAVVSCLLFGLYPAWRASKLKPVEALRYQ